MGAEEGQRARAKASGRAAAGRAIHVRAWVGAFFATTRSRPAAQELHAEIKWQPELFPTKCVNAFPARPQLDTGVERSQPARVLFLPLPFKQGLHSRPSPPTFSAYPRHLVPFFVLRLPSCSRLFGRPL